MIPKPKPSKKKDFNIKSDLSKIQKMIADAQRRDDEARQREDNMWREAEGPKSRAAKKRENKAEKRANAAARKAEARRLAEEEEKELGNSLNEKVRQKELREAAEDAERPEKMTRKKEKMLSRSMTKYEYDDMVLVENTNVVDISIMKAYAIADTLAHLRFMDKLKPTEIHRYYNHAGEEFEFSRFKASNRA